MGQLIVDFVNELFVFNVYCDYLEVYGIGVQFIEVLVEYWYWWICEEFKFFGDWVMVVEDLEVKEDYFKFGYCGVCFVFGYGVCLDLEDCVKMMVLLEFECIGVMLFEELQLYFEQLIDVFVLYYLEVKYFNV